MPHIYDVAIIGAGTAGLSALREVQRHTDNFVIINDGPYGTTCARVGCMPSKTFIEAANAFHRRTVFSEFGIHGDQALSIDVAAVLRRVRRLRDHFTQDILAVTTELGARSIAGRARFIAPELIDVDGRRIQARRTIVATGSHPILPSGSESLGARILTTDSFFEQSSLPPDIAVLGLGSVGTELAQALARVGIRVSAFGSSSLLAGLSDPFVNEQLHSQLSSEVRLFTGARASVSDGASGKIRVTSASGEVVVDAVLAALGRRPNLHGLGLDALGVAFDEDNVPNLDRTTRRIGELPIYLAGDVASELPVLHEAADHGYMAGINATRDSPICFERRVPLAIVFTDPNVAIIGTPFAKLDHEATAIGTVRFANQGRATLAAKNHGALRIYASRATSEIVGAELCAPNGEHLAHLIALAISRKLRVQDLLRMPFYHPVIEEGLRTALRDLSKQLHIDRPSDLANCKPVGANALD